MNELSLDSWVSLLKEEIVPSDMPVDVIRAFFYYLADQGMFERGEAGLWRMTGLGTHELQARIDDLARKEKTIFCFLRSSSDLPDIFSLKFNATKPTPDPLQNGKISDLSNLQIVRKMGRQLEPFIELEKNFLDYVIGPNTSKESARILFNYALERTRGKTKPPPWEQLSRRRHK